MTDPSVVSLKGQEITDEKEMAKQYLCEVLEVLSDVVRTPSSYQTP